MPTSSDAPAIIGLVGSHLGNEGTRKWDCGVLAPVNGKIYCIPSCARRVLCIDPVGTNGDIDSPTTTKTTLIGQDFGLGDYKWSDGVLCPTTSMIYGIPYNASRVLRIDPSSGSASLIGNDFGTAEAKWKCGVLSHGKIYAIPSNAQHVLQIDPCTDKTRLIGSVLSDLWMKWISCTLDPTDGNILCAPGQAEKVLRIDPRTETTTLLGKDLYNLRGSLEPLMCTSTTRGYATGLIYGIPRDFRKLGLVRIDPHTWTVAMVAFDDVDERDRASWTIAKLDCCLGAEFLCCPTATDTKFAIQIGAARMMLRWICGVRGSDGFVYGIPGQGGQVLRIDSTDTRLILQEARKLSDQTLVSRTGLVPIGVMVL